MKTFNYKFDDLQLNYDLSTLAPLDKILFLDIERIDSGNYAGQ